MNHYEKTHYNHYYYNYKVYILFSSRCYVGSVVVGAGVVEGGSAEEKCVKRKEQTAASTIITAQKENISGTPPDASWRSRSAREERRVRGTLSQLMILI